MFIVNVVVNAIKMLIGVIKLSRHCRSIKISEFTERNKKSFYRIKDAILGNGAVDFILKSKKS